MSILPTESLPVLEKRNLIPFLARGCNTAWWLFVGAWFTVWHLFITWPVWRDPLGRVPGPIGDNFVMLWNIGGVKYAFDHGSPGFWSHTAYFPNDFLLIYGSHTWLDGFLYWAMAALLPKGYEGAVLWANITMLTATVCTGLLIISALRAWGVRVWPVLLLVASAATFSWFRMFALRGHYSFFGTHWMLLAVCLLSWSRNAPERGEDRRRNLMEAGAGIAMGVSFLNDQTMAIFAGLLGGLVLLSLPSATPPQRAKQVALGGARFYGFALLIASIHLIPVLIAALQGRLNYHVDKSLPRLVDATSFFLPNDYHFLNRYLEDFRERSGFSWAEGTFLGFVPMGLLLLCTVASIRHVFKRFPGGQVCFYGTIAAWGFLLLGMGDRLMIGQDQYFLMPGRLIKEIPLLNNMRIPQRWVWPAHLCIALAGGSLLALWVDRLKGRSYTWAPLLALAVIPPIEGRSYPIPAPVDFRNDPVIRPPGFIEGIQSHYRSGGILTMPIEATHGYANILQFFLGYDFPMTVVYTARMPLTADDLPWKWSAWTPATGQWLRDRQVGMIAFPYHGGKLEEFQTWISEAKKAVPGLVVLNNKGEVIGLGGIAVGVDFVEQGGHSVDVAN